jgi:hypothetical protein
LTAPAYDKSAVICRAELRRVLDVKLPDRLARRITVASLPNSKKRAVASQIRQYLAGSNGSLGHDIGEKGGENGRNKVPKKRSSPPIMRLTIAIFVFLVLSGTSCIYAEGSKSTSNPVTRKLFIDPSSTSVRLGKATLIVSPLTRRGSNYIGDYQLKVRPYFFKSETGTLVLGVSEDFVRRLQSGRVIDFTGKALTREDGTIHVVLGRATPLSGDRGTVTFSIVTEKNAKIIFKTSYHFET